MCFRVSSLSDHIHARWSLSGLTFFSYSHTNEPDFLTAGWQDLPGHLPVNISTVLCCPLIPGFSYTGTCTQFGRQDHYSFLPFPDGWQTIATNTEQSLPVISGFPSDMLYNFTQATHPSYEQGPSVANWRSLASPDPIQESLKSALQSTFRQGKYYHYYCCYLWLIQLQNLEIYDLPMDFTVASRTWDLILKELNFQSAFTGVTVSTDADRLLSSEAKSRRTKTMPQLKQGVTLSHSS